MANFVGIEPSDPSPTTWNLRRRRHLPNKRPPCLPVWLVRTAIASGHARGRRRRDPRRGAVRPRPRRPRSSAARGSPTAARRTGSRSAASTRSVDDGRLRRSGVRDGLEALARADTSSCPASPTSSARCRASSCRRCVPPRSAGHGSRRSAPAPSCSRRRACSRASAPRPTGSRPPSSRAATRRRGRSERALRRRGQPAHVGRRDGGDRPVPAPRPPRLRSRRRGATRRACRWSRSNARADRRSSSSTRRRPSDGESLAPLLRGSSRTCARELSLRRPRAARRHEHPHALSRRFREQTGDDARAVGHARALRRAQQLLETTGHAVERVASLSGFPSAATLRAQFHRIVGTSPKAYRRSFRGEGA